MWMAHSHGMRLYAYAYACVYARLNVCVSVMETLTPLIFKLPPKKRALTFTRKLYKVQFNKPLLYDLLTWNLKWSPFLYCCATWFAARSHGHGEKYHLWIILSLSLAFPSSYRGVRYTLSFCFVSTIPQTNISACILAQVAAQKWLRHWKAIMKSESCLCAVMCQFISPSLVLGFLWLLPLYPLLSC